MAVIDTPAIVPENRTNAPTVCVFCSHNCGLRVDIENNHIVEVRADASNPITHGYSCNKAYALKHYVENAQRVQYPMKKQPDGSFERISWDQAVSEIGDKLKKIHKRYAGRSIALLGMGGQGNHMDGMYALSLLMSVESPMFFNSLAQEKSQHGLLNEWMFRAPSEAYFHADDKNTEYFMIMGSNLLISNRSKNATELIKAIQQDSRRTLVVVDPRKTETARRADIYLPIKVGTDVFFLLALAAIIVRENWTDQAFIKNHTKDYAPIAKRLNDIDPKDLAKRCGIPLEQMTQIAKDFAHAKSASILMDLGVEQSLFSTLSAYLMRLLQAITGNIGNQGGSVFMNIFSPKRPVVKLKPAKSLVAEIEAIAILVPMPMFSPSLVPEEILTDHPDRIRAVFVEGANPIIQHSDTKKFREAFAKLDLLVVIDPVFSETAQVADYVLPTPVGYEKWEMSSFPNGYPEISVQIRPPLLKGPEEALPEAEIYHRILQAAGLVSKAPKLLHHLAKQARTVWGGPLYLTALLSLAGAKGGVSTKVASLAIFWLYETLGPLLPSPVLAPQWMLCQLFALTRKKEMAKVFPEIQTMYHPFARGEFLFQQILDHPEGLHIGILDTDKNLRDHCTYPDHKIRLAPKPMLSEIERALNFVPHKNTKFPLILQGGMRTQWNANTILRNPEWRKGKGPHCMLWMHPDDAESLNLTHGQSAILETRRGHAEVPVKIDKSVQLGHVHLPNGFGLEYPDAETGKLVKNGVAVNDLTDAQDRDPFTGCPHHKYIQCRVRPAA